MIDFLICDTDEENMSNIKDDCFAYCFEKNYESEVHGFTDIEEAQAYILNENLKMTCMLACGQPVDSLINKIRNQNHSSYVVLIAQNLNELMKYTTPLVRPAGCLLKPVKREDVCYAIDSVIQDMRNGEEKSDVFQFKIRSREYYLDCEQIIMFEAACKKIVLYTDVQEYEFYESINHIMEVLPSYFVRSHKSYIINMHRVLEVNYKELTILLENNLVANLSRNLKNDFSEKINNYK